MPYSHHSHSGEFCRHASGTLEQVVVEAVRQGFEVYGLSEHVPRYRPQDLYPEEIEAGLSPSDLVDQFAAFLDAAHRLKAAYPHITLLVGLETDYVSETDLDELVRLLARERDRIDYVVGSVHHVCGIPIDFDRNTFERAVTAARAAETKVGHTRVADGAVKTEMNATTVVEPLRHRHTDLDRHTSPAEEYLCAYLDAQYRLLVCVRPEVIGHIDVCRLYVPSMRFSPAAWVKLERNVAYAVGYGALFEVNAAAFRKGWETAYPGKEVLSLIVEMGGRLTLSDDSHGPHRVGESYGRVRAYLESMGIEELWYLAPTSKPRPTDTQEDEDADGDGTSTTSTTDTPNTHIPTTFERGLEATRVPGNWLDHTFWKLDPAARQTAA